MSRRKTTKKTRSEAANRAAKPRTARRRASKATSLRPRAASAVTRERIRREAQGRMPGEDAKPHREPAHVPSPTALVAEAMRTGIVPHAVPRNPQDDAIPGEADTIRVGDPDDRALDNEYVGEQTPGGSTPTPDQSNVDEIGRAYGVQEEDSGELRTSSEMMAGRDHRRRGLGVKSRSS